MAFNLSGASDVNFGSPSNDQIVTFNGTSNKWVNKTAPGSSPAITSLSGNAVMYSTNPAVRGTSDATKRVMFITATQPTAMLSGDMWLSELDTSTGLPAWQAHLQAATLASPKRISVIGDSIAFGAAAFGSSVPKWRNSWPGILRNALIAVHGDAGTGVVLANNKSNGIRANPTYDPRWTWTGSITDSALGYFRKGVFTLNDGSANYIEFTCGNTPSTAVSAFRVHILAGTAGSCKVSIDGGATQTIRSIVGGTGITYDYAPDTGTFSKHLVTTVPAGSLGTHTIRVWGVGGNVQLYALEGVRTGLGKYFVDNVAISGEALSTFVSPTDNTNGTYGLPLIDSLGSQLLIIALGANDYNGGTALATAQNYLQTLIDRQVATGRDVMLYFPPISSPTLYPGGSAPTYAQYGAMYQQVADANNIPFLNHTYLWGPDYATGNAAGKYADTIHPNDNGAADIAASVKTFLGI